MLTRPKESVLDQEPRLRWTWVVAAVGAGGIVAVLIIAGGT